MVDEPEADPLREAFSGLSRPSRRAGDVLENLRPAMGRARHRRRVQVVSVTGAALVVVFVLGFVLRPAPGSQQIQIADESTTAENSLPRPDTAVAPTSVTFPTTVASADTTVPPPTTVDPLQVDPVTTGPPPPETPTPAPPSGEDPTPATTTPATGKAQSYAVATKNAGSVTVGFTATAITWVDVDPMPGFTGTVEDRTPTEVKVRFEGNGREVEVEIHLEHGSISHQVSEHGSEAESDDEPEHD